MNQSEFKAFSDLLADLADYYGKPLKPATIRIYWTALKAYDLPLVRRLLSEHVQASKFMPAVSEILDRLKAEDGRPGPEEAWAMIPHDEAASVVWTAEMATAFGTAYPLIREGETVQARMAFLERYRDLVRVARAEGRPVTWTPSLGHDANSREAALIEAVKLGRISRDHIAGLLPYRNDPPPEVKALLPDMSAKPSAVSLKAALLAAKKGKAE